MTVYKMRHQIPIYYVHQFTAQASHRQRSRSTIFIFLASVTVAVCQCTTFWHTLGIFITLLLLLDCTSVTCGGIRSLPANTHPSAHIVQTLRAHQFTHVLIHKCLYRDPTRTQAHFSHDTDTRPLFSSRTTAAKRESLQFQKYTRSVNLDQAISRQLNLRWKGLFQLWQVASLF